MLIDDYKIEEFVNHLSEEDELEENDLDDDYEGFIVDDEY